MLSNPVPSSVSSGARGRGRGRGRAAGARGGASNCCAAPTQKWWAALTDSCPISLVPFAELEQPPFGLAADAPVQGARREVAPGVQVSHLFDARFLAHWLVSSGDLSNPVNRRPLTRAECFNLDGHVRIYHPELDAVSVGDAFDLQVRRNANRDQQPESQTLQKEANSVLQALFRWRGTSRPTSDSTGHRVVFREGGLQVVDDDDVVEGPGSAQFLQLDHTSEASGLAFPPLSDTSVGSSSSMWPCPRPATTAVPVSAASESRSTLPLREVESSSRRPRLQLKPRSHDLPEPGAPSRNEAIFGAARSREEAGYKSANDEPATAGLCAFSRGILVQLVHGLQQIRTRLLPDIEHALEQFLADTATRTIEFGPMNDMCLRAVQELSDHCLLDTERLQQPGNASDIRPVMSLLRIQKNSSSRTPSCWLTRAVGLFSHLVPTSDELRPRASRDGYVLLTFQGQHGKGTGLEETLQRFSKASELDAPLWLAGGRHVLQRFARRSAAQKCCAAVHSRLWIAQWWSGDADWAQWQLRQLSAAQTQQRSRSGAVASAAVQPPVPLAAAIDKRYQMAQLDATIGGKWAALAGDEDDDDDDDDAAASEDAEECEKSSAESDA